MELLGAKAQVGRFKRRWMLLDNGMRKVLVIGSGGAGKSTFARRLGALLELEVIHLDSLYWSAGWVEMPKAEWQRVVEELLSRRAWIIDGNYSGTLQMRLEACERVYH